MKIENGISDQHKTMAVILLLAGLFLMRSPTTAMAQQVFTQMGCRIVIERDDDLVTAIGIIEANKPTRADYTLRTLKIDAAGSGTIEQSGSLSLEPGEPTPTSQVSFRLSSTGWLEFKLDVSERLTGTTCKAEDIVSPM